MKVSENPDMTISSSEYSWNAAIEAFESECEPDSLNDPVFICEYDQEFIEFVENSEKRHSFVVINDLAIITHNTTKVHTFIQKVLCKEICAAATKSSNLSPMISQCDYILCCNAYTCGSIQQKYYDGGVYMKYDWNLSTKKNPEVVFEVAFTHEPFDVLFYECCHFLTRYVSDTIYSIGIYIRPSTTTFEMRFFVLRRICPYNASDALYIGDLYIRRKKDPNLCLSTWVKIPNRLTRPFCAKFFNTNLCYSRLLTHADILNGAFIRFRLDDLVLDQEIELSNEMLLALYGLWDEWRGNQ
ncbi:hypothetical protein MDAP_002693 [Mitosporidium daphniae]